MELQEADAILTRQRQDEEARETRWREDQRIAQEHRQSSLAKAREKDIAECEKAIAAYTAAKEAINGLSADTLYRTDGASLPDLLLRALNKAQIRLARLKADDARVRDLQRQRAELPKDLRDMTRLQS